MLKEKFVSNTGSHKDLKRHRGRSGPNFCYPLSAQFASPIQFASFTRA
jgi:hypothetical protein